LAKVFKFRGGDAIEGADEWTGRLHHTDQGLRHKSIGNAMLFLENMPEMQGAFRFNSFTKEIEIVRAWPWDSATERPLTESDITHIIRWLESLGQFGINQALAFAAVQAVAERASYNPLQDWLNGLKWDGVERIDYWMHEYLGCEESDYITAISAKFLIGAVARALNPGCKMDNMLILEGPQGILKSSSLEALFGRDYFTDEIADFGSKDAAMQLQGAWCVEVAELSTFGRAAAERTKEFVSRRVDRLRPPYGRMLVKWPRTTVLVGTTNEMAEYFRDHTGNRRFWPVLCAGIKKDDLAANREHLWAEAVARYRKPERWWLEGEENALAVEQQEKRYDEEPWFDQIRKHVTGLVIDQTTSHDVLTAGLSVPVAQINQSMKNRVGRCMRKLGWRLTFPKDEHGLTTRVWTRPSTVENCNG